MEPRLVEVYRVALDADAAALDFYFQLLSPEERQRAMQFRFPKLRGRFIACRGALREILSRDLEQDPAQIEFVHNDYGKPSIRGGGVEFNVSNSHQWAMVAVTRGREVGIDIERVDARFVRDQIPERFFSANEVSRLRGLPSDQQTDAFFRCWTRKEAYIKARGMGLGLALDSFDVTLEPGEPAAFLRGAGNYTIQALAAPDGFEAAVVAEGADWTVRLMGGRALAQAA